MNAFILDNSINSRTDLGLRITQPPSVPATKQVVDSIQVDGREGSLTILRGWEDTAFSVKAALLGANIPARWRSVLPQILSAKTVYFSIDPAIYYNIKHVDAGPLTQRLSSLYEFSLTFICGPFRYIRNVAPASMTASGSLFNPGSVYSLPKMVVYGTGSRTLTINGKPITFAMIDYISGVMCAVAEKKLSSEVGFRGICKKILIFAVVALAHMLDAHIIGAIGVAGDYSAIRSAAIFFYLSNEGVSLLENVTRLGLPIPDKLKAILAQLHGKEGTK